MTEHTTSLDFVSSFHPFHEITPQSLSTALLQWSLTLRNTLEWPVNTFSAPSSLPPSLIVRSCTYSNRCGNSPMASQKILCHNGIAPALLKRIDFTRFWNPNKCGDSSILDRHGIFGDAGTKTDRFWIRWVYHVCNRNKFAIVFSQGYQFDLWGEVLFSLLFVSPWITSCLLLSLSLSFSLSFFCAPLGAI